MLNDARPDQFSKIYIRLGKTDCRMGISGLSNLIRFELRLNPFQKNVLFLFSGNSRKMIKALIWEGDGFLVMTKKASNGHFMWPKNPPLNILVSRIYFPMFAGILFLKK